MGRKAAAYLFLIAVIALGFWLRRDVPATTETFRKDRAFHYRMTMEVAAKGRVPEVDRLSNWPEGRKVAELLPTGMYYLTANYHGLTSRFTGYSLRDSILTFTSLAGCLIAVPVFFILKILWKANTPACAGAFLASIFSAHLSRTFSGWFKYENFGTLFITCSLAFLILALNQKTTLRTVLSSLAACVFMVLALTCWRLALVFLLFLDIFVLFVLVFGRDIPALKTAFAFIGTGSLIAFFFVPYLKAGGFILSKVSILTAGPLLIMSAQALPWLRKGGAARWRKKALVLGISVLILAGAVAAPNRESHAKIISHTWKRVLLSAGIRSSFDSVDRVLLAVHELKHYDIGEFSGNMCLSASAVFVPLVFILTLLYYGRKRKELPPGHGLLLFLLVVFTFLTFIARRNRIILAPLTGIAAGSCVFFPLQYISRHFAGKKSALFYLSVVLLILYVPVSIKTMEDSWGMTIRMGIDADNYAAIAWLRDNTPEETVVLCDWEDGYQVQTYAGRPTLTDGYLESSENRERIPEIGAAYFSDSEEDLRAICKNYGAGYVMFSIMGIQAHAFQGGVRFSDYVDRAGLLKSQIIPTLKGRSATVMKMICYPQELEHFEPCARLGNYLIFKVS